jgi:bla regulator protein BlaR1
MNSSLQALWAIIADNSLRASAFILCILLLRALLHRRMPAQCFHLLWVLVACRLLLPVSVESRWSVFNLITPQADSPAPARLQWNVRTEPLPVNEPERSVASIGALAKPLKAEAQTFTARDWLPALWLTGVGVQVCLLASSAWRMRRLLRQATPATDAGLLALAHECARKAGVRGSLRLLQTDSVSAPAVVGLWRPRLLLPRDAEERWTEGELRFILLHECTHLRRHDLAAAWLLATARVIHWFNPLVWLATHLSRTDAELACDAAVLRRIDSPAAYGETLLRVAQSGTWRPMIVPTAGIFESKRALRSRLAQIGSYSKPGLLHTAIGVLFVGAVAVAFGADAETVNRDAEASGPANPAFIPSPAGPAWAVGWAVTRVVLPSSGNIRHAYVDLRTPEGREITLTSGIVSKEGVTLGSVDWIGSPIRAKVILHKDDEPAPFFVDTALVSRNDELKERSRQVEIEAKFIEVPNTLADQSPLLGGAGSEARAGTDTPGARIVGVVTDAQYQVLLRELNQTKGVDLLGVPRVTTHSKQRAVIEIIREFRYATAWDPPDAQNKDWTPNKFETKNVGLTLEVEPTLGEEGVIDLNLVPQFVEFLGFVDQATKKPLLTTKLDAHANLIDRATGLGIDPKAKLTGRYEPVFSTRRITTTLSVYSGQSIILRLAEVEKDRLLPAPNADYTLFAIVTARIIDSYGERIATDRPQSVGRNVSDLGIVTVAPGTSTPAQPIPVSADGLPPGTAVPNKPGFVTSPHAPSSGYIDVRGFPAGAEVKCPYSGKMFRVPAK